MEHLSIEQPTTKLTLEEVRNRFETWRRSRKRSHRIPESLWAEAVKVCTEHKVYQVSRSLGLDYTVLKRRAAETERRVKKPSASETGFVELYLGQETQPVLCNIEMESATGGKLKMSFSSRCRELDPLELARVFWGGGR
jgi:hypothetical protein